MDLHYPIWKSLIISDSVILKGKKLYFELFFEILCVIMISLLNVNMEDHILSIILEEVDKISNMEELHESGFVGSEHECVMDFTTNEVN